MICRTFHKKYRVTICLIALNTEILLNLPNIWIKEKKNCNERNTRMKRMKNLYEKQQKCKNWFLCVFQTHSLAHVAIFSPVTAFVNESATCASVGMNCNPMTPACSWSRTWCSPISMCLVRERYASLDASLMALRLSQ